MKINILGAGALGSICAAHLIAAGHDVTLIARGRRARQVVETGLRIRGLCVLDCSARVVTEAVDVPPAELLIVTVKTYDTASAIAPLAAHGVDSVFSVANGVMKNDELRAHFGAAAVLGCMADTSGELRDDGEVRFTRNVCLHVGALDAAGAERAARVAETLHAAGIMSRAEADIECIEWSKFVGWIALFVVSVTSRLPTARFLAEPKLAGLMVKIVREMGAIARARKITIIDQSPLPVAGLLRVSDDEAVARITALGTDWLRDAPAHRMSSLQDLERGKRLEVDETLGHALQIAREQRVAVPTLETCYQLAAGIDAAQARGAAPD